MVIAQAGDTGKPFRLPDDCDNLWWLRIHWPERRLLKQAFAPSTPQDSDGVCNWIDPRLIRKTVNISGFARQRTHRKCDTQYASMLTAGSAPCMTSPTSGQAVHLCKPDTYIVLNRDSAPLYRPRLTLRARSTGGVVSGTRAGAFQWSCLEPSCCNHSGGIYPQPFDSSLTLR